MITIHEAKAADFATLGLGALLPSECTVRERAGGMYELKIVHPITDDGRHHRIKPMRIIKAPAPVRETPLVEIDQTGTIYRDIYKVVTDGRRLYLRVNPDSNSKGLHTYKPGTEVMGIELSTDGKWRKVVILDGGATGWMWAGNLEYVRTETENIVGDTPGGVVQPRQTREQLFRVYFYSPDTKTRTITAEARHITYDLAGAVVDGEYSPENVPANQVCAQIMARADHDVSDFHIYCTVSTPISGEYGGRNILDCLLDPETGVVAQTKARIVRDNYDIFILPDEVRSRGVELRYGKNLLSAYMDTDVTDTITRIKPVGKDKDGEPLYIDENGGWVDSPYINDYPVVYAQEVEYNVVESDDLPINKARALLKEKAKADFAAGCDMAAVKLDADFVRLELTDDYKHLANQYALHLYDSVPVIDREADIVAAARMTEYVYDAILDEYQDTGLGELDEVKSTIYGYELAAGTVSGGKLIPNTVNGDRLQNLSVGYGKFDLAAIKHLSADAITAIRADIRELVAGNITTDQLYADLAVIAAAQITAANIEKANIQWAQIENLSAEIAKVVHAEIGNLEVDWAGIYEADIEWANITNLTAEIAKITAATIEKATINWAQIVDVKIGTADIEDATITTAKIALGAITSALIKAGAIGTAQIADGSITEAKIVSLNADVIKTGTLSADRLLIKGTGGLFYEINATAGGLTSTQLTQEQYKNAISGTALVARSVTADKIAAKTITANEILSGTITAAEINVANLFAADATIAALDNYILRTQTIEAIEGKLDVWASDKIRLAVDNVQVGGRNYILGTGTPYTAVGTGTRQWLFPWPCASVEAANSLFGKTVTISFDCDVAITSGEFRVQVAQLWWPVRIFDSSTPSGHFTWTSKIDAAPNPTNDMFINIDGTWTGSVTFRNVKLEIGNKETDWTPAPEDTGAAIAKVSADLVTQAGVIAANAQKIETVSQAAGAAQNAANAAQNTAGAAQNAANAAQNAANGAQSTASGAVTRVTKAEERISAVEGAITSKVSKEEFDELGRLVSAQETKIEQTDEQVLILAGRRVGGRNYILGTGTPYTAVGTGTRQWLYPWHCASSEAANRLFGNTVTISFDYDAAITSGSLLVQTNILWWGVKSFGVGTESKHFSLTRKYDAAITADDVFIYIDGTWTGSVTFRNLKVELGDTATDWTPAPEDAAKSVDTGGAVRIDQTGVHMSGGTIEMETADGDEYIHIRNDGISASSLSAPNVAKRYSGPTGLYVNPNATSAQIAAGNYFRSLSDALATINNRMLDYNVGIMMASGMSDYTDAVISGVYGDGSILIYGENATVYGTVTVRNSHAQVIISQLNAAIPSGVERAAYEVRNAFLTIYSSTMSGNNRAFTVDVNGYLDARSCVFKVNAEISAYVLRSTASFEECIGNGYMVCHRGNMTAYGKVPIGNVAYWESCVPNNVSSLIPTGTDGTPAAPVISTVTYNYTRSDSYRGGWSYFDTDAPRQGFNGMDIYGTIWFDAAAIRNALSGKTIKQASLRLFMVKGVGRGRSVVVQLYGTNMGYDGRSGRPELTTSYGTIGTTEPDMNNEMTIPTAVIDDIVSGRIQALVLKSDDTDEYKDKFYSENYARFEGGTDKTTADNCPRLTVVYQ